MSERPKRVTWLSVELPDSARGLFPPIAVTCVTQDTLMPDGQRVESPLALVVDDASGVLVAIEGGPHSLMALLEEMRLALGRTVVLSGRG